MDAFDLAHVSPWDSRRSRNRWAAARRASSGSTRRRRASSTTAKRRSPISSKSASRAAGSGSGARSSRPAVAARRWSLRAYSSAGQVLGDLAEDAGLAARLAGLDRVPVAQHLAAPSGLDLAEDVRVAADELLAAVLGDRREIAGAALLEQQREEVDLEEHVAELVEELRVVAGVGGVGELVGLLDGVRDDRALVLLAVPRTLHAQAARERVEAAERLGDLGGRHEPGSLRVPGRDAVRRGRGPCDATAAASSAPAAPAPAARRPGRPRPSWSPSARSCTGA